MCVCVCVCHSRFMSDNHIFVKRNARWNAPNDTQESSVNAAKHAKNSSFSHNIQTATWTRTFMVFRNCGVATLPHHWLMHRCTTSHRNVCLHCTVFPFLLRKWTIYEANAFYMQLECRVDWDPMIPARTYTPTPDFKAHTHEWWGKEQRHDNEFNASEKTTYCWTRKCDFPSEPNKCIYKKHTEITFLHTNPTHTRKKNTVDNF